MLTIHIELLISIPKREEENQTWLNFLITANSTHDWKPTTKMWICSDHFYVTCFEIGAGNRKTVKAGHSPCRLSSELAPSHV